MNKYEKDYNIYADNEEELKFWSSKILGDINKDINDMTKYFRLENIKNIKVNLLIEKKDEK